MCQIELCGVATCDVLIVRAAVLVFTVFTCVLTLKICSRSNQALKKASQIYILITFSSVCLLVLDAASATRRDRR